MLGSLVGTQESVATNQECSAFCSSVPDCQGWTRNQEDGVCILLSEIAREINNPEWDWGPRCCQSFDKQIALGSPATEPKTMLTNQKCSVWCSSVQNCQGWSRNQADGSCFLLSEIIKEINNPDWVWGPRCGF